MRFITLDFESHFSDDYTLKKLTTEAYIRDPRFEAHGAAIKWSRDHKAKWYPERELRHVLAEEDWADVCMIHHHAQFDGLILSHHYNVHPRMFGCTLSMARLLLGNHVSVSLDSVRKHFGMPPKITPYDRFKGRHWHELDRQTQELMTDGACDEVESIYTIFQRFLAGGFPREELEVVDTTIKTFTEPVLRADVDALARVWESENVRKQNMTLALSYRYAIPAAEMEDHLQSADKFAALLRLEGVEPETKLSVKENEIYAFAKSDPFMRDDLLEHEDDRVRDLAEARLGVKSTLLQTRAETLGFMARRGPLPVYLNYCGAHTTRWSGGDKCNWQNLNLPIESAIIPPEGYWAFAPDASQIECRLLNFVAGQDDKIADFRLGRDPYVGVAEAFCGHPVNKKDHPVLRQAGKVVELQAGYQSGGAKIKATLRNKANIIISDEEGERYKRAYRDTHPMVEKLWGTAGRMIARLAGGDPVDWGPVQIRDGKLWLPNGCACNYPNLEYRVDNEIGDQFWRYKNRNGWTKLYGGKLVENCLSGTTEVLTLEGWKPIKTVGAETPVWDGVEFVSHAGAAFRGVQETGYLSGVWMTRDHKVRSKDGWVRAAQAEGLQRAEVWLPDCATGLRLDGAKAAVEASVHLWEGSYTKHHRHDEKSVVRMQEKRTDRSREHSPRNVRSSGVLGVAVDERSLPVAVTRGVEKLWWPGYQSLQALARMFRELLGRHGRILRAGFDIGAGQELAGIQFEKLCVGDVPPASQKSTGEPKYKNPVGGNDGQRSGSTFGNWGDHASLPDHERLAAEGVVRHAKRYESTYDILNCGPRHRFVVRGSEGPLIVHNCIQALARVVISQAMIRIVRMGYRVINTKHDSMWILIPKDGREQEHLQTCMAEMKRAPDWLPGIPLDAEGSLGERYSK